MSISGVLFDKDGTLISFQDTWGPATHAVIHALAAGDESKVRAQAELLHFSLEDRSFFPSSPLIAGSSSSYGALWGEALGRSDLVELKREIDALTAVESLKSLTPIGDPAGVMEALRQMGLSVGVATNDSEASARRQIHAMRLGGLMDFVAGYDSGHGSKPDPGMILAFAAQLGVPPSRVAMVGDTLHDLDCARAAGALGVAVLTGPATREVLAPRADHVIEDIAALPALLTGLMGRG